MTYVRLYAAAAEAVGHDTFESTHRTLGELIAHLGGDQTSRKVLDKCSFVIDGRRTDDGATRIDGAATIDVLPPFAGG